MDDNLLDGVLDLDVCEAVVPLLAECAAELLELWLLAELTDELEPE
ncbi:MAG: hypothetical protein WCF68_12815 [Terriglobales bacterium]